jgi:hypothetical protein
MTALEAIAVCLLGVSGAAGLSGCSSSPEPADNQVGMGMSRSDLRLRFGEPLRIEKVGSGGEDWFYRCTSWNSTPVAESGTAIESGEVTTYASAGLEISSETQERPIHISASGVVVGPLPEGKVERSTR